MHSHLLRPLLLRPSIPRGVQARIMSEDRTRKTKRMPPQREKTPTRLRIPARPNCPTNIAPSNLPLGRPQKNLHRQMRPIHPGRRISTQDARPLQRRTPPLRQSGEPERGMKRTQNRVFARRHPSFPPRDRRGHRCDRYPKYLPKPCPQAKATYPGAKIRPSRPHVSPACAGLVPGVRAGPRKRRNAHPALQRIGSRTQNVRPRILPTRTMPSSVPGRRSGIIPNGQNGQNPASWVVRRLIRRGRMHSPASSPRSA
jgi:hypothetical protein